MSDLSEKKGNRGGARPGSGRKKTGLLTKNYTIHLPLDVALEMEKRAEQKHVTVNRYIRDLIENSAKYGNVSVQGKHVDEPGRGKNIDLSEKSCFSYSLDSFNDMPMAAEDEKPYVVDKCNKGGSHE